MKNILILIGFIFMILFIVDLVWIGFSKYNNIFYNTSFNWWSVYTLIIIFIIMVICILIYIKKTY